ncbi:LysM peptidoglycan-binding domain-containing protein [Bacillus sp. JJ1764]|uniref:LysM peptidoglycan-binding domain-containing protein n=1 Tax=Bacillus sp. JJ1764 TaxID=3122964 RepID=UPI002FFFAC56
MNKEDQYRDQAESLRQKVKEINGNTNHTVENMDPLPPREQLHRNKKKKMKWKVKYPVIRLLVLFFFLLPVIIFSVIFYRDGHKISNAVKTSGEHVGYETVNLETTKEKKIKDQRKTENTPVGKEDENSQIQSETAPPNTGEVSNQGGANFGGSDKNSTPQKVVVKPQPKPAPQQTSKVVYHTVRAKETLFGIAMKYYRSQTGMDIIKRANQLQGDQLTEGQVLKIPLNQ